MVSILGGKMRTKPLLFPKSILIETCNLCQGSCLFCPYFKIRKGQKKELLEYKIIKKLINEMTDYYVERLTLFNNNEPLLDDRIYKIIKFAHKVLPKVEITLSTNGRCLTKDKIYQLYKTGLTTLYISIPTLDPIFYNKIMGYEIIKILQVLDDINDSNILDMIKIAVPITKYFKEEEFNNYFNKKNIRICSWHAEYKENWGIDEAIKPIVDFNQYIGPCDRPMDQAVILFNGNMVICCRDWHEQNVIGNIKDNTIYELWKNDKMISIQKKIARQKYDEIECCRTCSLNFNCYKRMVKKVGLPE